MDTNALKALLEAVAQGQTTPAAALAHIQAAEPLGGFEDLGFAKLDTHRALRLGFPEVIFGQGKTSAQLLALAQRMLAQQDRLLITRVDPQAAEHVLSALPGGAHHPLARTLTYGQPPQPPQGLVVVACAGTTDLPVAEEAAQTARIMGARVELAADVGVAGLHRVLAQLPLLREARVVVAVAGMEGALPSVIGGLVACPVVAVPTSVGYGASLGGIAALLAMLNSCAPGVSVVNIDNGFGAGYAAARINALKE